MDVTAENTIINKSPNRVAVFSLRNLHRLVVRGVDYEFEDLIGKMDQVDLYAPTPKASFNISSKTTIHLARKLGCKHICLGTNKVELRHNYDLFLAVCLLPRDLMLINSVKDWRNKSKIAVCWLSEFWKEDIANWKGQIKLLSQFDHIILNCRDSVLKLQEATGRPCHYIPPGVDTIQFCPYPQAPQRVIDVLSIGRRSEVTHKHLLEMANNNNLFYIYDTIDNLVTSNIIEHRQLIANLTKRTRYFIANRAKIDMSFETNDQTEIGFRFYEGAAAGTIMIGDLPSSDEFLRQFPDKDVTIHIPYDSSNIADILHELDSRAEQLEAARMSSIINSLQEHDWLYRWKSILDICNLEPLPGFFKRQKRLEELIEYVKNTSPAEKTEKTPV